MRKITANQRLELIGLFALAQRCLSQLKSIKEAAVELLPVPNAADRIDDAFWGGDAVQDVDQMLAMMEFECDPTPKIEWCDQCPHAMHLHYPDGSCPCGINCSERRKAAAQA